MADTKTRPIGTAELDVLFRRISDYDHVFLAVSGGADSTALMHLVGKWRGLIGAAAPDVRVLTVDHGLRPASASEAKSVVAMADSLGLPAEILLWQGIKPVSGLQETAREARYALMIDHIRCQVTEPARAALVTAHHSEDLAETVLMRLARGGGVDGLSAIQAVTCRNGIAIFRPLLSVPKQRLRATLVIAGQTWTEDPSNQQQQFERVRLRSPEAVKARDELGLDDAHLALTAQRMARARSALDAMTSDCMKPYRGDPMLVRFGVFVWRWPAGTIADEIAIRALTRVLAGIGGIVRPPRLQRIERLWETMQRENFTGVTLGNCVIARSKSTETIIYREPARAPLPQVDMDMAGVTIWDNRFELELKTRSESGKHGRLRVRALERQDLKAPGFEPAEEPLPCPIEALQATPVVVDEAGPLTIPALNMHRDMRGDGAQAMAAPVIMCRFMTERLGLGAAG